MFATLGWLCLMFPWLPYVVCILSLLYDQGQPHVEHKKVSEAMNDVNDMMLINFFQLNNNVNYMILLMLMMR
jgi:hypothetical protein